MRKEALFAAVAAGVALGATAAPADLAVGDGRWDLKGRGLSVVEVDGLPAIAVETGIAYRRDVQLEDGTIDLDVKLTHRRSFVYLMFRMEDDRDYEEIYLRPHKSSLPDSIQYAPVYQGQSAWQLHHGPGATAAVDLPAGRWLHLRLVLQGRSAALFLGEGKEPALVVPRLARAPRAGYIALRGFVPQGTPGEGPCAWYRDVRVLPGVADFAFPAASEAPEAGAVRSWMLSQAFALRADDVPVLPDESAVGPWRRVDAEPSGLLELHRYVRLAEGQRETTAAARVHVRAAGAAIRPLDLGFSDRATVFLNGQPLFHGEAGYSFDNPRREGLIGYDQARLYLPLRQGDNDLVVVVGDSFGGMGLMARFPDTSGIEVEAR